MKQPNQGNSWAEVKLGCDVSRLSMGRYKRNYQESLGELGAVANVSNASGIDGSVKARGSRRRYKESGVRLGTPRALKFTACFVSLETRKDIYLVRGVVRCFC